MTVEKIQYTDTLRQGADKINAAIDQSNEAIEKATTADTNASQALALAQNVQTQLDTIVIEGDSSVEAAQARVDADGNVFTTLKERLDTKEMQFSQDIEALQVNFSQYTAQPVYNVKGFGAVGDGVTDDTVAMQYAINTGSGGTIYIPDGTYMIDPSVGIDIPSNTTIIFAPNAILKNMAHNLRHYEVIRIHDKENVILVNPQVDGNRSANSATGGEWGMGISIRGSKNIKIYNPVCKNCWGDGIYIGSTETLAYCENIRIFDALCDNNRRQGISLISGKQIYLVRPKLINTNGTSPQAGLDIEPNENTEILDGIFVLDPYTEGNAGAGITINPTMLANASKTISIYITNHINIGGQSNAFTVYGSSGSLTGFIKCIDPTWINVYRDAFTARNWSANFPRVEIIRPKLINPNIEGGTSSKYHSAFTIYAEDTDPGTDRLGNIHIYEPEIIVTSGIGPIRTLFINDYRTAVSKPVNISFINPKNAPYQDSTHPLYVNAENIFIKDDLRVLNYEPNNSLTLEYSNYRRTVTSKNFTANRTITLAKFPVGFEITFESWGTYYLTIVPEATDTILPLGRGAGKYIRSNQKGSKITLRKVDNNTWFVTEMIGTWEAEP